MNGGRKHRKRSCMMSDSEIIAISVYFHFGSFRNFKHCYLHYVGEHLKQNFPNQLSYSRFHPIRTSGNMRFCNRTHTERPPDFSRAIDFIADFRLKVLNMRVTMAFKALLSVHCLSKSEMLCSFAFITSSFYCLGI